MDTAAYTVPYITGWSDSNLDVLRTSASRVLDVARAITTALGVPDGTPSSMTREPRPRWPSPRDLSQVSRQPSPADSALDQLP